MRYISKMPREAPGLIAVSISSLTLPLLLTLAACSQQPAGVPDRYGPRCATAVDCTGDLECMAHINLAHQVTRKTCERSCKGMGQGTCPEGKLCTHIDHGPHPEHGGGVCL
jgi:hypothetical protein